MHPTLRGRSVLLCLLTGLLVLLPGLAASAHSALIGSNPETGSTIRTLPTQLELQFNEPVSDISPAMVLRRDGSTVATLTPRADGSRLVADAPAETLPDGRYSLVWRVVSADGHPVDGVATFTLAGGPTPTPSSTATDIDPVSPEPTATARAAATSSDAAPSRTGAYALGGLAALAVLGVVVALVRRSRPTTDQENTP